MLRCFSFVSTALSHALSSHPHPSPDPRLDSTHVRLHAVRHPLSCLRPPASAEALSPRARPVVFAVWSLEALLHAMPPYVPEACSTSREGGYMALLFARLLRRPGVKGCLMQKLQQPCSLPEPPWLHCPCPTWMGHRGMCHALDCSSTRSTFETASAGMPLPYSAFHHRAAGWLYGWRCASSHTIEVASPSAIIRRM